MTDTLAARTGAAFEAAYGAPATVYVQAPGRVNLIGEHTDYNDGFVLPCAIGYRTVIAARPREDGVVRLLALDQHGETDTFPLDEPLAPVTTPFWANYVRGVIDQLSKGGVPVAGMDLAIAGDIPQGAGLSSSASLSVAVGTLFGKLPPVQTALVAQAAENDFAGCHCGNMDQIASACGVDGHALMIDCRSLDVDPVPIPPGAAIVILHSKVKRGLVDSEYNTRRRQCEAAAAHFGVPALRDLDAATLAERGHELDPVTLRRARHVVTENARVLDAATALAAGDLARMGELMAASHASMRDDFEITVPSIDRLVDIVKGVIGAAGGVRMTGGGFGGCVVALVPQALLDGVRAAVERDYRAPNGELADIHVCHAAGGAGMLDVQRDARAGEPRPA